MYLIVCIVIVMNELVTVKAASLVHTSILSKHTVDIQRLKLWISLRTIYVIPKKIRYLLSFFVVSWLVFFYYSHSLSTILLTQSCHWSGLIYYIYPWIVARQNSIGMNIPGWLFFFSTQEDNIKNVLLIIMFKMNFTKNFETKTITQTNVNSVILSSCNAGHFNRSYQLKQRISFHRPSDLAHAEPFRTPE